MQIFRLDTDLEKNSRAYPDKYTYNQIRESAQAMSTAITLEGGEVKYGSSHEHHPITQWLRSYENWMECYRVTEAVHDEYQRRYGSGVHDSWDEIQFIRDEASEVLPRTGGSLQPCAFDDRYCHLHPDPTTMDEVVANYRNYVREVKAEESWFKYNHGDRPEWLSEEVLAEA
ncbi:MAG: hypothetical protein ABEH81_01305 [Halopenitus sp.]